MGLRNVWVAIILACLGAGLFAQPARIEFAVSEWPPAEYSVGSEARGYHVDTVRAVLASLGLTAGFSFYPWKRAEMLAQRKEVSALLSLHPTPERKAQLYFSHEPLSSSDNVLFVLRGREFAAPRVQALVGKTVGTTAGYNYGEAFAHLVSQGAVTIDAATTDEQGMRKLVAGRFDAFLCDRVVGLGLLRSLELREQVSVLPLVVSSVPLHAAFAKTDANAQLIPKFDAALRKLKKSGEWQRIMDGYVK